MVAAFLHALFSAARIALEVSAARGKWGGWENEERVWGPLQVAESAVRGGLYPTPVPFAPHLHLVCILCPTSTPCFPHLHLGLLCFASICNLGLLISPL